MSNVNIDEAAIIEMVNDPAGGIAAELALQAGLIQNEIKARLDVERPPGTEREQLPGTVPYRRTGRLRDSIKVTDFGEHEGLIAVGIFADKADAPHADVYLNREPPARGAQRQWQIIPDRLLGDE